MSNTKFYATGKRDSVKGPVIPCLFNMIIKFEMHIRKIDIAVFGMVFLLGSLHAVAQQKTISLDEAKSMAIENNKQIKEAQQNVQAAEAARSSAQAADKPTLDATISGLYLGKPLNTLLPGYSLSGQLSLTEVVYAGGKIRNGKKMAGTAVSLQASQKALTTSDVLLETETSYWQLVSLQEQVLLARKYILLLDTLLQDLNNSYEAGMINKNDVLRVKVQLNDAEITLKEANDGLEISRRSFAQLIGTGTLDFELADQVPDTLVQANLLADPNEAVNQRPEVAILENALEAQKVQTDLLSGDRRPSLMLSLNGLYARGNQINFSNGSDQFTTMVGLVSLKVPILDWGGRKQKVKEQQSKVQAQVFDLDDTKEQLGIEIRNAYLELKRSMLKVQLSKESLGQAEENLRLLNDQFTAGTITGKDVLEGQVLWQEAYAQVIDAKAELKINEARYNKAIAEY